CDGSDAEWDALTSHLVEAGALVRLSEDRKPNSFWARTDPADVARVEDRTFICTRTKRGAGPTNHWRDPVEMKAEMTKLSRGSMCGGTMSVSSFRMGPIDGDDVMFGVATADSGYVAPPLRVRTRICQRVRDALGADGDFVRCLHSVGA